jgi:protein gp37
MADGTHIEWTDATWNPITGCSVVSPGCTNCYAMRLAGTRMKHHPSRAGLTRETKAGPVWTGEVRVNWEWLDQPLRWSRPRMIFVCAHGDLFHESVDWETIAQIYGVGIAAHHLRGHILQVLTKRHERARELLNRDDFWDLANSTASMEITSRTDPLTRRSDDARATCDDYTPGNPPPGIWLGVSVEDQVRADERIPALLETPAAVRWLSMEPLLGPVDLNALAEGAENLNALTGLRENPFGDIVTRRYGSKIDWVVVGGESGPNARPMHPDWARLIRDQCAAADVPFHFKQWGAWAPDPAGDRCVDLTGRNMPNLEPHGANGDGTVRVADVGKKRAGRLLDGVEHNGFPA